MPTLDLTDDEKLALVAHLKGTRSNMTPSRMRRASTR
jgi:hypothetical protein